MPGPDDLYQAEVALLVAAQQALAQTVGGVPGVAIVSPGAPPWDCEMAAVWWSPIDRGGATAGSQPLLHQPVWLNLVQMTLLVTRCFPVGDENGNPPTDVEINSAAQQVAQDAWAINSHVAKRFLAGTLFGGKCSEFAMTPITQMEPQGAMCGMQVSFTVEIDGYDS